MDILNTHSSLDSWVGTLAWRSLRNRPLLVRTRHLSTLVRDNRPTRWLYQTPAAIITTGKVTKDLLIERLGVPARRIFSIPTGVELAEFAPQEKSRELLAQLQIPADAFIFGCVAVLRSWKGHLDLLEAFHEILQQGARAFLLLVGEGPYRVVIEEKIAQLGVQHRVRLAGFRDQVAPWFALMDVKVLASYANEGVPQSLLQALAMARPVVGTTVGGIPEVIVDAETGLLVPPRDTRPGPGHGPADGRSDYRRALGRRGGKLVVEKFSIEQMAAEIERRCMRCCVLGQKGGEGSDCAHAALAGNGWGFVPRPGNRKPASRGRWNYSVGYLVIPGQSGRWWSSGGLSCWAVRHWTRRQVMQGNYWRRRGTRRGNDYRWELSRRRPGGP